MSKICLYGKFYDVTDFMGKHPGGTKIFKNYIVSDDANFVDATPAFEQFHKHSDSKLVSRYLASLKVVGSAKQNDNTMSTEYRALYRKCMDLGFFEPNYFYVFLRLSQQVLLLFANLYLLRLGYFYTSILGLSVTFAQSGWIQHEAGHNSLTCIPKIDKFIQLILFNLHLGGSAMFWNYQHTNHHAATQHVMHDIDLDTHPLLIMSQKKYNGYVRNILNRIQAYTWFWFQNSFVTYLWQFIVHLRYAIRKRDYIYIGTGILHPTIWMYIFRACCGSYYDAFIVYNAVHIIGLDILLFTFTVSHITTEAHDAKLDWVTNAIVHTVNVKPNWFVDWWMGYLNLQIEHHLFPCMPQYNLIKVRPLVKDLALRMNLPYKDYSFFEAYRQVFVFLDKVGRDV